VSELIIRDLVATVAGETILRGVNLEVRSGEVHAVMGPNGAGKSTLSGVLMGHPDYTVLEGSATLDGIELLGLPTWERARAGLFLAPQASTEVPGVRLIDVLTESALAGGRDTGHLAAALEEEAGLIGVAAGMAERALNMDASGGEKKRLETLQLAMLQPKIAILDELDSGLDVDALRDVARRVQSAVRSPSRGAAPLGVIAITHYRRLLEVLVPDVVHVLVHGEIVATGGSELVDELERDGYRAYLGEPEAASLATSYLPL
jgi:Fe-S cluster assembly ATP-binding protein